MIREIACADAVQYIKQIEDDSVDLIVLDPNYDDWEALLQTDFLSDCIRILKDTGNILCFTKQPFDMELRQAINPIFRREIIWTFDNGGAWVSKQMPLVSFQKIYWCIKSKNFFFNPRTGQEYAEVTKNFKRARKVWEGTDVEGRQFVKSEEGTWIRDHLHFNKPQAGKIPAKPYDLIKILIHCFSPVGGLIYDPFSGAGTIAKVGDALDREVIANELDEERCMKIIDYFTELLNEEPDAQISIFDYLEDLKREGRR